MLQQTNFSGTPSKILPGFTTPVQDSQQWYRAVLNSMSRPGTLSNMPEHVIKQAPAGISAVTASVALTLLDHETTVWMETDQPEQANVREITPHNELMAWLKFHCGCPIITEQERAMFAIITDGTNLPDIPRFAIGTPEFPDRSTTLILQVASLAQGQQIILHGPGIEKEASIAVDGLSDAFWQAQETNAIIFPQGFDTILTAPEGLVCIPRSVTVRR